MAGGWEDYVDNLKKGGCQLAGIFGQDGNPWAANFTPTTEEIKKIVTTIKGTCPQSDDGPGITLEGKKYTVLELALNDFLKLKRKNDETDDTKKYLFIIELTNTAAVCGAACGGSERGCLGAVESVRDYLKTLNF